ncbi:MAG: hypothetical protein ACLSUZ_01975 [Bifidobacterium pseudocatenulatum]
MAVTKVAGHGTQMDKFTIDEAFSLDDETGKPILDGMAPTMNTRLHFTGVQPRSITSTEGTADSTFLNGLLDSSVPGTCPHAHAGSISASPTTPTPRTSRRS